MSNAFRIALAACAILGLTEVGAARATVFTETVITGDSSIFTPEKTVLVKAANLGSGATNQTVNGITFTADNSGLTNFQAATGNFNTDPFSAALDAILDPIVFAPNLDPATLTLSGLEVGARYILQLLFSNDVNVTGNNVKITIQGDTYVQDNWQPAPINLIAEFVAVSAAQAVTFTPNTPSSIGRAVLSGYALFQAPEPSVLALLGIGLVGLGIARRRRAASPDR